jgi:methyl-accepting chemotaxis protein
VGIIVLVSAFMLSERTLIMQERQSGVQQTVESVHSMVASIQAQVASGNMTDQEARKRALVAVKSMRYSGSEYFWINDMHPTMVMHPIKPELDGKDLTDNKDPTGKHLFIEFVNTVKTGGSGFVWYMWPKPGSADPVQKVSFVKGFEPWGWIIGSGVYVDNVDAAIGKRLVYALGWSVALAVVLGSTGLFISRSIIKQLGGEPTEAKRITRRMAGGDLSVTFKLERGDNESLLYAIKELRDGFANIVGRVRAGSEGVANASAEIALGDRDLSSRTEQQASALEETSASMEELNSMVKQNAESAHEANLLAVSACAVAVEGGEAVGRVVETMKGINDSSQRIFDIISVIDGIAFQTNILALNAAVEAARAGEQGRGFAVVATEVRSLAGRSAEAAKEIKTLIGASVERVERGTELVDRAGTTMLEIVTSFKRVADIMGHISKASNEQALGVSQVGEAVVLMDQTTQQNAALVEEIAAAALNLKSQADELVAMVATFNIGD